MHIGLDIETRYRHKVDIGRNRRLGWDIRIDSVI